jgi:PrsW family intramembrane metalloprotease
LTIVAGASIVISILAALVGSLGVFPAPLMVLVVLATVSISVRLALILRARSASALARARVMRVVSTAGLALSCVIALATLGVALQHDNPTNLVTDVLLRAWSLSLLAAAASPVRTVGWRELLGVGLAGFLVVPVLARMVGVPVYSVLGPNSVIAVAVWAPFTEEVLKVLPVVIFLFVAMRNTSARPSAVDATLLGAWAGSAFALFENSQNGIDQVNWTVALPFSAIFPTMSTSQGLGYTVFATSHTVWSALLGAGVGFGMLYYRRFRFAWIAIPATFLICFVEHFQFNASTIRGAGGAAVLVSVLSQLSFGGLVSAIVLVVGLGVLVWFERLGLRGHSTYVQGIVLTPEVVATRRRVFAAAQLHRSVKAIAVAK